MIFMMYISGKEKGKMFQRVIQEYDMLYRMFDTTQTYYLKK